MTNLVLRGEGAVRALATAAPAFRSPNAICVIRRNPFDPSVRESHVVTRPVKLATLAKRHGIEAKAQPTLCKVDGKYVLQRDWRQTWIRDGHFVEFQALPQGSGNSALGLGLTIALIVASFALGPAAPLAWGGGLGLLLGASGGIATAISAGAAAAVLAGGTLLLNAVIPPAAPALGDLSSGTAAALPSPTYSLGAQGNQARLGQPIPVLYGRHIIYPDYAATPWGFFSGSKAYLNALLCLTQGELDIERTRIGETDIDRFPSVIEQAVGPGGNVTLFDTNVYSAREVTGQTLFGEDDEEDNIEVGPFPACPPGTTINSVDLDFVFPSGFYQLDNDGNIVNTRITVQIRAREIDDDGITIGSFVNIGDYQIDSKKKHTFRQTITRDLPYAARWEVVTRRTDNAVAVGEGVDTIQWAGLKGHLTNVTAFGAVSLLALRMQASDSLNNNTSRLINVIGTRKLPIWNGTSWSAPTATRSIAWAVADVLRNSVYGLGLSDDQYDLAALLQLDAIWAARGDTFNGVFDQSSIGWDALTQILRAGRAVPYQQGGMVRFYRDQAQTLPVGMFSVANIKLDSFRLEFAFPITGETADGVEAEYFDERTWRPKKITAGVGGSPTDPASEQLFGVTVNAQAVREAAYMAAANRYRRVFCSFATELEGLIPSKGDQVLVAHELPSWGISGNVMAWDSGPLVLTLDAPIDLAAGFTWTLILRDQRNSPSAAVVVTQGDATDEIVLASAPVYEGGAPFTVVTAADREPTHYAIGKSGQAPVQVLVTNIAPRGDRLVEISAVIEDVRVHVN